MSSAHLSWLNDQEATSKGSSVIALACSVEAVGEHDISVRACFFRHPNVTPQVLSEGWKKRMSCSGQFALSDTLQKRGERALRAAELLHSKAAPNSKASPNLDWLSRCARSILAAELYDDLALGVESQQDVPDVRVCGYTLDDLDILMSLETDADSTQPLWNALDGNSHVPRSDIDKNLFKTVLANRHFQKVEDQRQSFPDPYNSILCGKDSTKDRPVVQFGCDREDLRLTTMTRDLIPQYLLPLRQYKEDSKIDNDWETTWDDLPEINAIEGAVPSDEPPFTSLPVVDRSTVNVLDTPSGMITLYEFSLKLNEEEVGLPWQQWLERRV